MRRWQGYETEQVHGLLGWPFAIGVARRTATQWYLLDFVQRSGTFPNASLDIQIIPLMGCSWRRWRSGRVEAGGLNSRGWLTLLTVLARDAYCCCPH